MKIGIDLDDVIAETRIKYLEWIGLKLDKTISIGDILFYNIWENKAIGGTRESEAKDFSDFYNSDLFDKIELVEDVLEILFKLRNHNLYIITSRALKFREKTENFLKKYFKNVNLEIIYSGDLCKENGKSKAEICEELGLDYFIEDNADFSKECAEKKIKVLLFDRPWNQRFNHADVIRVRGWREILGKIGEVENE